jgi:thioredoxin reductase (NADPH)
LTLGRLGRDVVLLSEGVPGGELLKIERIDGLPGHPDGVAGYDLCPAAQEQAEEAGVRLVDVAASSVVERDGGWLVASEAGDFRARAVVVATGTAMAKLGVPGEDRLEGRGVSECASCDGPLLRGKTAIVAGGGDSAMQEALVLAGHAAKVVMLVRGGQLDGQASYRSLVLADPKIELRFNCVPVEIGGDAQVTHVKTRDLTTGAEEDIAADAIFTFVGLVPNTAVVDGLVSLGGTGRISVDAAMRTTARGICAAGNVREGSPHRAAGAMGDAAAAAVAIDNYLTTGDWPAT